MSDMRGQPQVRHNAPRAGSPTAQGPVASTSPAGLPSTMPKTDEAMVRLVNVKKQFGEQVVLDGISIDFARGQSTVVMGPSGCGKSVMLKHVIGLLAPDSGEVYVDGQRIDRLKERDLAPIRLKVALLFQMGALFDSMSVLENVEFPLREHTTLTRDERRARIAEALALVDMRGSESKLPAQLSGGQRKRVALARAIVLKPRAVLYDEPTTGLDPIRSDGINELILKLRNELGVTSIVVTHDLVSARKVADRVVMLMKGHVVASGTFDEVERSPDPAVRRFLLGQYDRTDE